MRFLGDEKKISPTTAENLIKLAQTETDVQVRSQLACTAKRLSAKDGLSIAPKIAARNLDAQDPHIPLLLWWAVEKHCVSEVKETLDLFATEENGKSTIIRETILPRLMRRYATEASEKTLTACARFARNFSGKTARPNVGFTGTRIPRTTVGNRISKLEKLPESLQKQLTSLWKDERGTKL